MNRIFTFTGMNTIFKRCVFASAAHALMAGEYTMLSSEISWDGDNYFFQDMEGCRGVIAFTRGLFVCGIQNIRTYTKETEEIVHTMLDGASEQVVEHARKKVLPYLLTDDEGARPAVTVICFGNNETIYAACTEKEFMEQSDNILLPYLYDEKDMKAYWTDYYKMNSEQVALVEELYQRRVTEGRFVLTPEIRDTIYGWFGEGIDICRESMSEMGITLP